MKETNKNSVEGLLAYTADKVLEMSKTSPVLSTPVTTENGSSVITVNDVSIGFAGGGMDAGANKKKSSPSGSGGKIDVQPKAVIIMDENGITVKKVNEDSAPSESTAVKLVKKLLSKKDKN